MSRNLPVVVALFFASAPFCAAQAPTAEFTGTIRDVSGAVIPVRK